MFLATWSRDGARRIGLDRAFAHEVLEERAQRGEMSRRRCAAQFLARAMGEIGANREMVDALQIDLIARHRQVLIAEESEEGFEVVAVGADGVDRDIALVREVIEEIANLVLHPPLPVLV